MVIASGSIKCWGYNYFGELGNGTTEGSLTPVLVSGISSATAVVAGLGDNLSNSYGFTCALLAGGSVDCWGYNYYGELGTGSITGSGMRANKPCSTTPVPVSGISSATAITAGDVHTCVLLAGGSVDCWGSNGSGALGNATIEYSLYWCRGERDQ